jgi:uncharacterized protein
MKMNRDTLHHNKALVESLAEQFGARRIRLFGSFARGQETPESDVDFLVDFPKGYNLLTQRIPLLEALEAFTGRKVDLIPEHELHPFLQQHILDEAIEL